MPSFLLYFQHPAAPLNSAASEYLPVFPLDNGLLEATGGLLPSGSSHGRGSTQGAEGAKERGQLSASVTRSGLGGRCGRGRLGLQPELPTARLSTPLGGHPLPGCFPGPS